MRRHSPSLTASPRRRMTLQALERRETPAIFTVTNANDAGAGSLRDAIAQANADLAADTINFDPAFFSTPRVIALASALPDVRTEMTLNGPGASLVNVQANGTFRTFNVDVDAKQGEVTFRGLTISGGNAGTTNEVGGNIRCVDDRLTVADCVITGGRAVNGGGIGTDGFAFVTIRNSTISNNTATGPGGGLHLGPFGVLAVSNSTVSGNTAAAGGGGILLDGTSTAVIENSTVSGNTAGNGGGLYSASPQPFVGGPSVSGINLRNVTIHGNQAGFGGGILVDGGLGLNNPIHLANVTIVGNTATSGGFGGGIAYSSGGGNVTLTSSVLAFNTAGTGNDIVNLGSGAIQANNSLVRDQSGISLVGTGNLPAGTDPQFVGGATPTLASNGGTVQTVAIASAASPLVNAGVNGVAYGVDARGNGFPRTVGTSTDIGAVEFAATPGRPSANASLPMVTANGATAYTFTVAYADVAGVNVGIDAGSFGNDDVTVTFTDPSGATLFTGPATFESNTGSVATYSITPPGGSFDAADYGRVRVAVNANAVADLDGNAVDAVTAGTAIVATPATFTVTTNADAGAGSLRDALAQANARTLSPDVINLTGVTGTIALASGLVIADPVTVTGPGSANLTLAAGNNSVRLLQIAMEGSQAANVSGLTLTGGNSSGGAGILIANEVVTLDDVAVSNCTSSGPGGGIAIQRGGFVTIRNSLITGNRTTGAGDVGNGGGISLQTDGATLTLENSTVSNNTAGNSGGGISERQKGRVVLRNSTVSGNTANRAGGGVYFGNQGTALVENSTLSGNTATVFQGGGFYFYGPTSPGGAVVIRNSTIAGNQAVNGGGVAINSFGFNTGDTRPAPILIQNSTIAGNTATASGGGFSDDNPAPGNTVTFESTVVARNSAPASPDVVGTAGSHGGTPTINAVRSLVRDQTGASLPNYAAQNNLPAGTDPLFDGGATPALAFSGGPTRTIALLAGSPLLDAGANPANLTTDQRGPGFPRLVGAAVDVGAFEGIGDAPSSVAGPLPDATTLGGTTYSFDVTYGGATPVNVATLDDNDIRVTGPNGYTQLAQFVGVTPPGNGSPRTATYRITAPGGTFDHTDNGTYTVALQPGQVADTNGNTAAGASLGIFRVLVGQTYTVTNLNDAGPGSLRQAIFDANATPGAYDAIVFQPGLTGTITLASQLTITDGVTINGPGAGALSVSGGGAVRVFAIDGPGVIDVTLAGLTVTGGSSGVGSFDGGGIRVTDERVTLDRLVVIGNVSSSGGGLSAAADAFITVRDSTISGNTAINGGGIYARYGGLLLESTTVSGNIATGTLSTQGGGGIFFTGTVNAGGFTVRNSTIAGNTTGRSGGGIVLRSFSGTALIRNSTITGNTANTTVTLAGAGGGGIALVSGSAASILTVESSIVSGNAATAANGRSDIAAIAAARVNANFSAIGDPDGFTPSGSSGNNLPFGAVLNLLPLAFNGGPTQTVALDAGSAALNAGSNPAGLATDQRGAGFARTSGTGTDIGAFEVQVATPPTVVAGGVRVNAGQANTAQRSRVTSIDVEFSTVVTFAGPVENAFRLSRIGGAAVGGFTASANVVGGRTVVTLSNFTGAETRGGSLADGRFQLTAVANQVTAGGLQLDGDGNGTGGDDFVLNGSTSGERLFSFFGDVTGDGVVDAADLGQFRPAYGASVGSPQYLDFLDFDGDGAVNAFDYSQFRNRFGAPVP